MDFKTLTLKVSTLQNSLIVPSSFSVDTVSFPIISQIIMTSMCPFQCYLSMSKCISFACLNNGILLC